MLDNLTEENVARWRQQIEMDYQDLSESEKESDRQWARKAIEVVGILVALSPDENAQKDEV